MTNNEGVIRLKVPYICGPLSELPPRRRRPARQLYERLAKTADSVTGTTAFVPHKFYCPIQNAAATPQEVDATERRQVCERTSVPVVVMIGASWGGGIEVEMAYRSGVRIVVLAHERKFRQRRCSWLLLGNPGIDRVLTYKNSRDAEGQLRRYLLEIAQET